MKIDVIGSNSLLFANLPPASQVPGRTYRVSDVGPAPGILLTSNGTRWRPANGRQVLAMRAGNPVTVQSLSGEVAETIGPFPGGLVRAGMRLELDYSVTLPTVGAVNRIPAARIGSGAARSTWWAPATSASGAGIGRGAPNLAVISDINAAHPGGLGSTNTFAHGLLGQFTPTVDFSTAWSADLFFTSAAETAVNISSATWAGGIATFNTAAAHTLAVGDKTVTASVTPSGWNIPAGAIVLTVPTTTQFTVAMAADPGAYTSGGTSSRISNMISQSYVLELVG